MSGIGKILLKAALYEKRALDALKTAQTINRTMSSLSSLLGKSLTYDEFEDWSTKNKSILDPIDLGYSNTFGVKFNLTMINNESFLIKNDYEDDYFFIGKTSKPPEGYNITSSSFLMGNSVIPNLFLFDATKEYPVANKEMAHEQWLIEGLQELFGWSTARNHVNDINEFIINNKSAINNVRRYFEGSPQMLGRGLDGVAFGISPKLVLKIFKNVTAYNQAVLANKRLHLHPELAKTEAMIYDVGILGTFENRKIYYYIIERMITVTDISSDLYHYLTEITGVMQDYIDKDDVLKWRPIKSLFYDPKNHAALKKNILQEAKKLTDLVIIKNFETIKEIENLLKAKGEDFYPRNNRQGLPKLKSTWINSLAEELIVKHLTDRLDLHMGNMGLTNYGEFRFFDPAYGI